jgi:hypothetical protein
VALCDGEWHETEARVSERPVVRHLGNLELGLAELTSRSVKRVMRARGVIANVDGGAKCQQSLTLFLPEIQLT